MRDRDYLATRQIITLADGRAGLEYRPGNDLTRFPIPARSASADTNPKRKRGIAENRLPVEPFRRFTLAGASG